jgi:hypothetical protein
MKARIAALAMVVGIALDGQSSASWRPTTASGR